MSLSSKIKPVLDLLLCTLVLANLPLSYASQAEDDSGKAVYNYYCYQCHGYAGDAATLTTTFISPPPRNFTALKQADLSREAMIEAVTQGRPGTAMVGFSRVLNSEQIAAVVDFIRTQFMRGEPLKQRYHSVENGWADHQKYRSAFPFASGSIPLDTPWGELTEEQQAGKRLFMSACISCHDRAKVADEGEIWAHQAISYPRSSTFDPDQQLTYDAVTRATNFLYHEIPPELTNPSPAESRGQRLFNKNCAFCHGMDATGKNWIGSFMQPKAADLTQSPLVKAANSEPLQYVISNGIDNSSMPAWGEVLSRDEIASIIFYLKRIAAGSAAEQPLLRNQRNTAGQSTLQWNKSER